MDMAEADYTVVKMDDRALTFENLGREPVDVTPPRRGAGPARPGAARPVRPAPALYPGPQKATSNDALPTGITDYGNGYADSLLSVLAGKRRGLSGSAPRHGSRGGAAGRPPSSSAPTTTGRRRRLCGVSDSEPIPGRALRHGGPALFTDPDSYEKMVYEDYFLGSQGKRVGTLYAGTDDITLWKPKFETSFTYSVPLNAIERTGPFEESSSSRAGGGEDYFGGNPYTLYAGGDYNLARMTNHLNPDGPRILLIRDSYPCVLAPFLALNCSGSSPSICATSRKMCWTISVWLDPDLVCVMNTASSTRLPELFQFFRRGGKARIRY